ncbi:E3 ubiquitin-protein ligase RMA2 [Amborella trichopoda]|uniref:E3 ubiquitin-protein ligase RMA2 n=1 Tax=Amborella trichopoda TaxID=13333 RepID=UPI0005D46494|nr:E3 ubiquitin-protein ligase RMA2 [Amborella trichopoda]|eukprot:XP_011625435.1 E3 ubiquitin-protein ligase RMA2 [Amborella trichopoda]
MARGPTLRHASVATDRLQKIAVEGSSSPQKITTTTDDPMSTQKLATEELRGGGSSFDCNICLDFAQDPVVTLCGHLFCWPCIYKWLELHSNSQDCPVCKSALSQSNLIPLYGRGKTDISHSRKQLGSIPERPVGPRPGPAEPDHSLLDLRLRHDHYGSGTALRVGPDYYGSGPRVGPGYYGMGTAPRVMYPMVESLAGIVMGALPWVVGPTGDVDGLYWFGSEGEEEREREVGYERSLSRILTFLFCFALLCLIFF